MILAAADREVPFAAIPIGDYLAVEVQHPVRRSEPAPRAGSRLLRWPLEVVLIGEADREPLLAYLESRLHLASGRLPHLQVTRARRIDTSCRPACDITATTRCGHRMTRYPMRQRRA